MSLTRRYGSPKYISSTYFHLEILIAADWPLLILTFFKYFLYCFRFRNEFHLCLRSERLSYLVCSISLTDHLLSNLTATAQEPSFQYIVQKKNSRDIYIRVIDISFPTNKSALTTTSQTNSNIMLIKIQPDATSLQRGPILPHWREVAVPVL